MLVVMRSDATVSEIDGVIRTIESIGLRPHATAGADRTIVAVADAIGAGQAQCSTDLRFLEDSAGVEQVVPVSKAYEMVSREFKSVDTVVQVDGAAIGGDRFVVMAGPCAVETREQVMATARAVRNGGAKVLRGGAFKPRTSPYSFRGLGEEGLKILRDARGETGLPIVTEVISHDLVDLVCEYADILQVGSRNMQNYALLEAVGNVRKPVLLKRGMMSTVEELLMSAEYVVSNGNPRVILCERGIRTFENATRNTLDISAVPVIKRKSHLPVVVDPSHAAGNRDIIPALSLAAAAIGADGILVEVHPSPQTALCDGLQSLSFEQFDRMMTDVKAVAAALGRPIET
jgi:3-deoxy-7-phosphoheptulonate synthase